MTFQALLAPYLAKILIHTSVKLVTRNDRTFHRVRMHFNPHEREARDVLFVLLFKKINYFNPHEREARDMSVMSWPQCSQVF